MTLTTTPPDAPEATAAAPNPRVIRSTRRHVRFLYVTLGLLGALALALLMVPLIEPGRVTLVWWLLAAAGLLALAAPAWSLRSRRLLAEEARRPSPWKPAGARPLDFDRPWKERRRSS